MYHIVKRNDAFHIIRVATLIKMWMVSGMYLGSLMIMVHFNCCLNMALLDRLVQTVNLILSFLFNFEHASWLSQRLFVPFLKLNFQPPDIAFSVPCFKLFY